MMWSIAEKEMSSVKVHKERILISNKPVDVSNGSERESESESNPYFCFVWLKVGFGFTPHMIKRTKKTSAEMQKNFKENFRRTRTVWI